MVIIIYLLYSNNKIFKINTYYKLNIINKIGEGSYGYVYEINNDNVIKIFKNNTNLINNNKNEKIIPYKNENRELNFFINFIKNNFNKNNYIININAIGIIKYSNEEHLKINNNYCLILPKCKSIINLIKLWKIPLIKNKEGKELVLKFMKRLIEIELYLNENFKITNIDIKLNNYMILNTKKLDINNILAIDFGLILKNKKNVKYNINTNYYIWPKGKDINLNYISTYAICINGLILFLGEKNMINLSLKDNLKKIKDDNEFYNIFYNGLLLKIKCNDLYNLINLYLKNK